MTDTDRDSSVPPRDAPPRGGKAKSIPPLVWVIIALLFVMAVWGMYQHNGSRVTPGGGTMPQTDQGPTIMPQNNQPLPGSEPQNTMPPVNSAG